MNLNTWLADFISLIFPNRCLTCKDYLLNGERHICLKCFIDLPATSTINMPDNPVARIFNGRIDVYHAAAWMNFEKGNRAQTLIHELKYKNKPEVGTFLGELIGEEIKLATNIQLPDVVVPVPIHAAKKRQREYNQSEYIATGIAHSLAIPVDLKSLRRRLKSSSQTRKKRYARWENVSGVFAWNPVNEFQHAHILLVDDVITTGATIEACYRAIRSKYTGQISVISLARSN